MPSSPIVRLRHVLPIAAAASLLGCGGPKGDLAHGQELYAQCAACHKLQENSVGPKHCGLIGRAAGSVPGFEYSEAMKNSGIVWNAKTLDEFLVSPIGYVNGTKMGFAGFPDERDRVDVIAYLQHANEDPALCPKQ
jgi:cytochrome c